MKKKNLFINVSLLDKMGHLEHIFSYKQHISALGHYLPV